MATVKELLNLLSFPDCRHVCVRFPGEAYAGGGLVPDVKKRFGDLHVQRADIFENVFIIYATR